MNKDIRVIFEDMDSAFGQNFFEEDSFFGAGNSMFNNRRDFMNQEISLFNRNDRERDMQFDEFPVSVRSRLNPENNSLSLTSQFPSMSDKVGNSDFKWTEETKWEKVIKLNGTNSYSNININVKDNVLSIGAAEELNVEENGKKSMSSSLFSTCFSLPQNTINKSVKAEFEGSTIRVSGEVEKKMPEKIESVKTQEVQAIPIQFE